MVSYLVFGWEEFIERPGNVQEHYWVEGKAERVARVNLGLICVKREEVLWKGNS